MDIQRYACQPCIAETLNWEFDKPEYCYRIIACDAAQGERSYLASLDLMLHRFKKMTLN